MIRVQSDGCAALAIQAVQAPVDRESEPIALLSDLAKLLHAAPVQLRPYGREITANSQSL